MAMDVQRLEVTRTEIAEALGPAFGTQNLGRDALVATAARAGARPEVIELLRDLPARDFSDLRQLWSDLPEMPVR